MQITGKKFLRMADFCDMFIAQTKPHTQDCLVKECNMSRFQVKNAERFPMKKIGGLDMAKATT